jgi:hypothetical protein
MRSSRSDPTRAPTQVIIGIIYARTSVIFHMMCRNDGRKKQFIWLNKSDCNLNLLSLFCGTKEQDGLVNNQNKKGSSTVMGRALSSFNGCPSFSTNKSTLLEYSEMISDPMKWQEMNDLVCQAMTHSNVII